MPLSKIKSMLRWIEEASRSKALMEDICKDLLLENVVTRIYTKNKVFLSKRLMKNGGGNHLKIKTYENVYFLLLYNWNI